MVIKMFRWKWPFFHCTLKLTTRLFELRNLFKAKHVPIAFNMYTIVEAVSFLSLKLLNVMICGHNLRLESSLFCGSSCTWIIDFGIHNKCPIKKLHLLDKNPFCQHPWNYSISCLVVCHRKLSNDDVQCGLLWKCKHVDRRSIPFQIDT